MTRAEYRSYVLGNVNNRVSKAKQKLVKDIVADTDNLVPYKTGNLASDIDILPQGNGIRYSAEYAPFVVDMPAGTNFNKKVHPNATSNWNSKSYDKNVEKWIRMFKEEVKG